VNDEANVSRSRPAKATTNNKQNRRKRIMGKNLSIIKAVADPKDGRLVVHYKQDGGKVNKFKPADEIPTLEKERSYHISEERAFFAAALKNRKGKQGMDPASFLEYLVAERESNLMSLDLLRTMEIAFKRGVFRKDLRALHEAMNSYWGS
jgi:hypothetical protein